MRVPEAVLFDMDNRCFELRKAGLSYANIGKALGCSTQRAWNGVHRCMERISTKLAEDNRDAHRLELERLDNMLMHLWPLTMERVVKNEDGGGEMRVPPSMDAVDRVLKIMDRRAKLLGLDTQVMQFNVTGHQNEVTVGPAQKELGEITPQEEAMRLMKLFVDSGVMDPEVMTRIKNETGLDIVDAEIVPETHAPIGDPDSDGEPFFQGMPEDPGELPGEDLV